MSSNVFVGSVGAEFSIGVALSFTSPRPFFRSSLRRLGLGLPRFDSRSFYPFVFCASPESTQLSCRIACRGASSMVERFRSSSHSVVARSANSYFADHGGGIGLLVSEARRPRGGNSTIKYCCIIGHSFFPA